MAHICQLVISDIKKATFAKQNLRILLVKLTVEDSKIKKKLIILLKHQDHLASEPNHCSLTYSM